MKDGTTVEGDIKKIKRKKDHFAEVCKDCAAVAEQYGEDVDWDELAEHIMAYSKCE